MKILKNIPNDRDSVVVTLIEYKGSVPQTLGAKIIVTSDGLLEGTVGGGKVEAKAILTAIDILNNPKSENCSIVDWNLTRDVGMTCGGTVKFLFELNRPEAWSIVVFGAGHVAQELVPLLTKFDARVTCIDSRPEWLNRFEQKENLSLILNDDPKSLVKNFSSKDYFVLMTQGHSTDLPILTEILRQHNPIYVGAIGSETKALRLRNDLKTADFSKEKIESFFCPIGLKLGRSTPIEISVSVAAHLLQVRDENVKKIKGDL